MLKYAKKGPKIALWATRPLKKALKQNLTLKKIYSFRESLYDPNNGLKSVLGAKKIPKVWTFDAGLTKILIF
jgi:hypothetical protein